MTFLQPGLAWPAGYIIPTCSSSLPTYFLRFVRNGRFTFGFMISLLSHVLSCLWSAQVIVVSLCSWSISLSLVSLSSIYSRELFSHCIRCLVLWIYTVIEGKADPHTTNVSVLPNFKNSTDLQRVNFSQDYLFLYSTWPKLRR
jgi:hypothetical protein